MFGSITCMLLRLNKSLFDLILNIPVNNLSVMSGLFLAFTGTKAEDKVYRLRTQHSASAVRLEPAIPRSFVQCAHFITKSLRYNIDSHSLLIYIQTYVIPDQLFTK